MAGACKIILIGRTGSGKTTLIQRIERRAVAYHKTQTVQNHLHFIDTPGEYLENRSYYKGLIVSSYDADVIGLVQDCSADDNWLPPMFSSAFTKETVGIVTKVDLAADEAQIERAEEKLKQAGAARLFRISALEEIGLEELAAFIDEKSGAGKGA